MERDHSRDIMKNQLYRDGLKMTEDEFVAALQEELEIEDMQLDQETDLTQLDGYDSLATLSVIALVDEHFGKELSDDELRSVTTVKSLLKLIGIEQFE